MSAAAELDRVRVRISDVIMDEVREGASFHLDDLHAAVLRRCGTVAPASTCRVLRDLRRAGWLNYEVTCRAQSLYRWLPGERRAPERTEDEIRAEIRRHNAALVRLCRELDELRGNWLQLSLLA